MDTTLPLAIIAAICTVATFTSFRTDEPDNTTSRTTVNYPGKIIYTGTVADDPYTTASRTLTQRQITDKPAQNLITGIDIGGPVGTETGAVTSDSDPPAIVPPVIVPPVEKICVKDPLINDPDGNLLFQISESCYDGS